MTQHSWLSLTAAVLLGALPVTDAHAAAHKHPAKPMATQHAAFRSMTTAQDKSDMAYIAKLPRHSSAVEFDLADPIQYRYFMRQWQLAGVTPTLYPQLHKSFEALRQKHLARMTATNTTEALNLKQDMTPMSTTAQPIVPLNFLTSFTPASTSGQYTVTAFTSVPGTLQTPGTVTATTVGLYDGNNNQLGPATTVQQYGNGALMRNTNTAPNPTTPTVVAQGSYFYTTMENGQLVSHAGGLSARNALTTGQFSMQNTAPVDVNNNGTIKICIVRTDSDCDYKSTATGGQFIVQFPITDTFTIPDTFQSLANQQTYGWYSVTITQPDAGGGGGCTLPANFNLWNSITFPTPKSMYWNLNPGPFSNPNGQSVPCFPSNSNVVYDLQLLTLGTNTSGATTYYYGEVKTTTNPPPQPPPGSAYLVPMVVAYGCIADGTLITLADNTKEAIQNVSVGERVRTIPGGPALTVVKKTVGTEAADMIRLTTANGHNVLLTKTHPVMTSKGVKEANDVTPGMLVATVRGPSKITTVAREHFAGKVWNLDVGAPADHVALTENRTTFIAGGFVVGDSKMQKRIEDLTRERIAAAQMKAIPAEWRIDARNYFRQHAAHANLTP